MPFKTHYKELLYQENHLGQPDTTQPYRTIKILTNEFLGEKTFSLNFNDGEGKITTSVISQDQVIRLADSLGKMVEKEINGCSCNDSVREGVIQKFLIINADYCEGDSSPISLFRAARSALA